MVDVIFFRPFGAFWEMADVNIRPTSRILYNWVEGFRKGGHRALLFWVG